MKRSAVLILGTTLALSGAGLASGAAASHPHRSAAEKIPVAGTTATLVERNGIPSHVSKQGALSAAQTHRLIHDLNNLTAAPKGPFPCPNDNGHAEIAHFAGSDGKTWTMNIGSCGTFLVDMKSGSTTEPTLQSSKALLRDLDNDLANLRPNGEHVPSTVHHVTINYSVVAKPSATKTVTLTQAQAAALVHDFNHLRREPRDAVHCDAVGGPVYLVTFKGKHHSWTAREAICTNITVQRDGTSLPTLIQTPTWDKAVRADLKADSLTHQ